MRREKAAVGLAAIVAALSLGVPGGSAEPERTAGDALAAKEHETVPFTGLDVALIVGGGAGLITAGVGVRRAAARKA
ncbi:MAG TPA: hypothetical protein VKB00_07045 [Candidatus Limnocylindrales bacterium]|nr:hypothetical protein [Candidatus Limnocylindrales bacterium]